MSAPLNWLAALAIALVLAASALLDGPSDTQAAQDVADEADYAAALADSGAAKCARFGRHPHWTSQGDLVCRVPARVRPLQEARL
jgi:hypothetical protein